MLEVEGFRGHDPDRLRLAAPVVPPAGVPELDFLIGVVGAIVAQLALVRLVKTRPDREPTLRCNGIEGPETGGDRFAPGTEEDVPLGRPSLDDVRRRMPGKPFRLSTGGLYEVDVLISTVLPREGDPATVRTERGLGLGSVRRGESPGVTPVPIDDPDVVGVNERDFGSAHRRLTQKARLAVHGLGHSHRQRHARHQEHRRGGRTRDLEHRLHRWVS